MRRLYRAPWAPPDAHVRGIAGDGDEHVLAAACRSQRVRARLLRAARHAPQNADALFRAGRRRAQPRQVGRDHADRRHRDLVRAGGPRSRGAYESLRDEILGQLRAVMPVDIALFGLHGSMVADGYDDTEGDLLARARADRRPKAIVGAEYDMHCHITEKRVAAANISILFKEFRTRISRLVRRSWSISPFARRGGDPSRLGPVRLPHARSRVHDQPSEGRAFVDRIQAMEARTESCPSPSVTVSRPQMCRMSAIRSSCTRTATPPRPRRWRRGLVANSLNSAVSGACAREAENVLAVARKQRQPVVFADRWDNPGGGVPGDGTIMIEELLRYRTCRPPSVSYGTRSRSNSAAQQVGRKALVAHRRQGDANLGRAVDAHVVIGAVTRAHHSVRAEPGVNGAGGGGGDRHLDIVLRHRRAQTFSPKPSRTWASTSGRRRSSS